MAKSPGHQQAPQHQVRESHLPTRMRAKVNGGAVADSSNVIRVDEDSNPARFYFPRTDVRMEHLLPSSTTTHCPFKGTARYFTLQTGEEQLKDGAWSYEDPYEEHAALKDRIAFYDDKFPEIQVQPATDGS
jgi:uncharacterized protein (DUF427 family)